MSPDSECDSKEGDDHHELRVVELDETLAISATVPVTGAVNFEVSLLASLLLLHHLSREQVFEVGAELDQLVEHVLIGLTYPGGHGSWIVLFLVAEVSL